MKQRYKGTAQNRKKKPLLDNITFDDVKEAYQRTAADLRPGVKYPALFVLAKGITHLTEISITKKLNKK